MAVIKRVRIKGRRKIVFFQAEVSVRGQRVASKTFDTRGAAEVWHDETKRKFKSPGYSGDDYVTENWSFNDCLDAYLQFAEAKLRKSSFQSMTARFSNFRDASIAGVKMRDLDARAIDRWIEWLIAERNESSRCRKNFKAELKYLGVILNWYRNYKNPRFTIPIVKRHRESVYFKQVQKRRPDYFIPETDIVRFISQLRNDCNNPSYYRLATFMVLTGVRLGEACGLTWDSVDLASGTARIEKVVCWDHCSRDPYIVNDTKTEGSTRLIYLPESLVAMLSSMKREAQQSDPIFATQSGQLLRDNSVRRAFNKAFADLGLPWRGTHILRHTWATLGLKANNGNISQVQAQMGHSDRRITELYAKATATLDRGVVERTAALVGFGVSSE